MGDMADWAYSKALEEEAEYEILYEQNQDLKFSLLEDYRNGILCWITKDGDKILVDRMTDSHIENAIKYLRRRESDTAPLWIEIFSIEIVKRKI